MTVKLKAKDLKELATIAPEVHGAVVEFGRKRKTRRLFYENKPAGFCLYFAEGAQYRFFAPNGKVLDADMVSESTMGMAGGVGGINYAVGKKSPPLPEGTWILETELFLGAWMAHLYYVGPNQLDVGGEEE